MSQKKRTIILIVSSILVGLFIFYKLADMLAPGSYPYAEVYELNFPEQKVIRAIDKIISDNPELKGPVSYEDNDSTDYWHHTWIRFSGRLALTWTRPMGRNKTSFAFVSIYDDSKWKSINHDFGFFENRRLKKEFEEIILKKINQELNKN